MSKLKLTTENFEPFFLKPGMSKETHDIKFA